MSVIRHAGTMTALAALAGIPGCATMGTQSGADTAGGQSGPSVAVSQRTAAGWSIATREHVDLWLHGYAMLQRDTARVPFFRRGYRERLEARLASNPALVNGQFVPLYFASFDDLRRAVDLFMRVEGEPRAAGSQQGAFYVALLAASFPTAADRDWVRLFVQSLGEESDRFYHQYWTSAQRTHGAARVAVESSWRNTYAAKFERFLANTQQPRGEMLLSLPLDGEGRTLAAAGGRSAITAVGFSDDSASAVEALYVFAHEVVIPVVTTAITDNVTPAQQRSGVADQYSAHASVRGGALLLERIAPELADGYMRHYLRAARSSAGMSGDPRAAFAAAFPLPDLIVNAIARQLEAVLGGI